MHIRPTDILERLTVVDKVRRIGPLAFITSPCFGGPIYPTSRMLLSGWDH